MYFHKESNQSVYCNWQWEDKYHVPIWATVLAVIFTFLSLATTLVNILILVALRRDECLHPPSKRLLCNLTITDLCAGLISQPLTVAISSAGINKSGGEVCLLMEYSGFFFSAVFLGASSSTVTAISVDRLMALLLGIRYRQVVTVKRVRNVLILLWVKNILVGVVAYWNMNVYLSLCGVMVMIEMIISTYSYTRIFHYIWCRRKSVQDCRGEGPGAKLTIARYKKTVINSLWVHITLVACYFPFSLIIALSLIRGLNVTLYKGQLLAVVLVNFNSLFNPILYCWKIKNIRNTVKEIVTHFFASLHA